MTLTKINIETAKQLFATNRTADIRVVDTHPMSEPDQVMEFGINNVVIEVFHGKQRRLMFLKYEDVGQVYLVSK
ncbi:MAG: hypothetical protein ACXACD_21430 [Candidatus Thorarchaeota archaeon]|jgi:hypothetical protein